MAINFYELGSAKWQATLGHRTFSINCQDVTSYSRETNDPCFFWINLPFSEGSLHQFERMAAQTTHGIRYGAMGSIYNHVASMMRPGDSFVWLLPESPTIRDAIGSVSIFDTNYTWKSVANGRFNIIYSDNLSPIISFANISRLNSNDSLSSFSFLFPNGIKSRYDNIIDPAAGKNPLLEYCIKNDMSYYGVETNSMHTFNMVLLRKFVNKHNLSITCLPDALPNRPNGLVGGAPELPGYVESDKILDVRKGMNTNRLPGPMRKNDRLRLRHGG